MAELADPLDGCESRCRLRLLCRTAAANGHPDRLLCDVLPLLTCPRPVQPGVGHLTIVSCIAKTNIRKDYLISFFFLIEF